MRIVSWNIYNGGVGRADPIGEVLAAQHADVIALVEADDDFVLDRNARRLQMDLLVAADPHSAHRAAILSRHPIISSINHTLLDAAAGARSLLEATIRTPDHGDLPLFVLHLHPRASLADEATRLQQIAALLRVTAPLRAAKCPHLLAGDFNANAPSQIIDPAACKPSTRESIAAQGHLPRQAIQSLLDAGYLDSNPAATTLGTFTTQHPGQRIDYIFTHGFPPNSIRQAWIESDRLAKYASDHYPIGAEIRR